ncbi:hypothetical protein B0T16DRAFT_462900 [Cercophora newfieldiana]|uniref:Xylanolytic transcriptional activator regulatory domain-containing protein n=1 Tax=Cercophora newfieldiana TaxID=92897 RepID=A0AA40CI53_9PEZI|nr:hypothetical protein B0T16DRAFT_462900 [Cercophora newfieldiana]
MRCDGQTPTCSPCAERGRACLFPTTRRVRGPGKSKQRIEALEARLAAIESFGSAGGGAPLPLKDPPPGTEPPDGPSPIAIPPSAQSTPFFDAAPGIPLFQKLSQHKFRTIRGEECMKPLQRPTLSPLTASPADIYLLQETADDICAELPFLNIPRFLQTFDRPEDVSEAGWQGLMNAMIASAIAQKTHPRSISDVAPHSWAFFRNAYAVLPELLMQGDNIRAVQAYVAMVLFTRQSGDARTAARLLGMAIRMFQTIGPTIGPGCVGNMVCQERPNVEEEERQRLSLTTFILDMEIAVNTGLPPAHTSDTASSLTGPPTDPDWCDPVFKARLDLAQIQHRITTALTNPTQASLIALESDLESWSLRVPPSIRPTWHYQTSFNPTTNSDQEQQLKLPLPLPVAILHLIYYNSLCMVSWALVRHVTDQLLKSGLPGSAIDCFAISDRTSHHRNVARTTARAVLHTMSHFPNLVSSSYPDLWRVLAYPLAASIALLAIVCKEPAHAEAHGDVELLGRFKGFLERMVSEEGCDLERMRDGVTKFEMVASDAVAVAIGTSAMPVNPALWPLAMASGQTGKAMAILMTCSSYVPMYLAQALIGNLPNRDTRNAKKLTDILEIPWLEIGYGPFVPDSLIPATYGFVPASGSVA